MGSGCRPLPYAVRRVRDPIAGYSAPVKKPAAGPRPRKIGRPRRRVARTFNTMNPRGSKRAGGKHHASSLSGGVGAFTKRNGAGAGERPDDEGQLEQERAVPGTTTESHQNAGSRDTTPAEQRETPRARSEAASTTPGVTAPNNEGRGGSVAKSRRGRSRRSGRGSRAASAGRAADTSRDAEPPIFHASRSKMSCGWIPNAVNDARYRPTAASHIPSGGDNQDKPPEAGPEHRCTRTAGGTNGLSSSHGHAP